MSKPALYYEIGTSIAGMQTLDILGITAPFQAPYAPYTVEIDAADSRVYGHGLSSTAWLWGFVTQAERDLLKAYCPGKSAVVYIRTHDDDWEYVYCQAVMIWQPETPPSNGYIVDFSIAFRILQNYGVSPP
jgi:hypothetical protein